MLCNSSCTPVGGHFHWHTMTVLPPGFCTRLNGKLWQIHRLGLVATWPAETTWCSCAAGSPTFPTTDFSGLLETPLILLSGETATGLPDFFSTTDFGCQRLQLVTNSQIPALPTHNSGLGTSPCRGSRQSLGPHEYLAPLSTDAPLAGQQWDFGEGRNKTCLVLGHVLRELVSEWKGIPTPARRAAALNCPLRLSVQRRRQDKQPSLRTRPRSPHAPRGCSARDSEWPTAKMDSAEKEVHSRAHKVCNP